MPEVSLVSRKRVQHLPLQAASGPLCRRALAQDCHVNVTVYYKHTCAQNPRALWIASWLPRVSWGFPLTYLFLSPARACVRAVSARTHAHSLALTLNIRGSSPSFCKHFIAPLSKPDLISFSSSSSNGRALRLVHPPSRTLNQSLEPMSLRWRSRNALKSFAVESTDLNTTFSQKQALVS